jgi:hypothetical protein
MNGYSTTSEMLGESEMAVERQVLAAEEDHRMVEPGTPDRRDRAVIKGLPKDRFRRSRPRARPTIGRI